MSVESVNQLSRLVGVSLRLWSGYSPTSLILRGIIQTAIPAFFAVLLLKGSTSGQVSGAAAEMEYLKALIIPAMIVLIVLMAIGVVRILVGVLDFVPRKRVTGVVLSVADRKLGDFLPHFAQQLIFMRNPHNMDKRKTRTEVVLRTDQGDRQWTLRNRKTESLLQVGSYVELTVSPLVGYVAQVQVLGPGGRPASPHLYRQ